MLRNPLSLKTFYGNMAVYWFDSNGDEIPALAETTGELRILLCGYDAAGVEEIFLEDDGTLKNSNYGWNGAALTKILLETTGEQKIVAHGKDAAGNIDPFRTNANMQQQVEIVGSTVVPTSRGVLARADLSATTNTDVYTPTVAAVLSTIYICNRNATPVTIRVALHNGTVANEDYIYYDYPVQAYGTLVIGEDIQLTANTDVVMVYSDTANVSVVVIGKEYA